MIRLLEQQREDLDGRIAQTIEDDDDWRGTSAIVQGVPGVGPATTAAALIGSLPELGKLNRQSRVSSSWPARMMSRLGQQVR